jgi:hypothetical protein
MLFVGAKQIGGKRTDDVDNTTLHDTDASKRREQEEEYNRQLPVFEGNVENTPVNAKQAMTAMGMDPSVVNTKGDPNFSETGLESGMPGWNMGNTNASSQNIANKYYEDLVKAARRSGYNINDFRDPKTHKIDYKQVKDAVLEAGTALNKTAANINGVNPSYSGNMDKLYFGDFVGKTEDGEFKNSEYVSKIDVRENGTNGEPIGKEQNKELAKTARVIGLNFNADKPGTLSFVADNKVWKLSLNRY